MVPLQWSDSQAMMVKCGCQPLLTPADKAPSAMSSVHKSSKLVFYDGYVDTDRAKLYELPEWEAMACIVNTMNIPENIPVGVRGKVNGLQRGDCTSSFYVQRAHKDSNGVSTLHLSRRR